MTPNDLQMVHMDHSINFAPCNINNFNKSVHVYIEFMIFGNSHVSGVQIWVGNPWPPPPQAPPQASPSSFIGHPKEKPIAPPSPPPQANPSSIAPPHPPPRPPSQPKLTHWTPQ